MEENQEVADKIMKVAAKIEKLLKDFPPPEAMATINYCFLKMILSGNPGLIPAQAMAAVFMNNIVNSLQMFYENDIDDDDDDDLDEEPPSQMLKN
jgi:hypothetical protein